MRHQGREMAAGPVHQCPGAASRKRTEPWPGLFWNEGGQGGVAQTKSAEGTRTSEQGTAGSFGGHQGCGSKIVCRVGRGGLEAGYEH